MQLCEHNWNKLWWLLSWYKCLLYSKRKCLCLWLSCGQKMRNKFYEDAVEFDYYFQIWLGFRWYKCKFIGNNWSAVCYCFLPCWYLDGNNLELAYIDHVIGKKKGKKKHGKHQITSTKSQGIGFWDIVTLKLLIKSLLSINSCMVYPWFLPGLFITCYYVADGSLSFIPNFMRRSHNRPMPVYQEIGNIQ